MPVLGQIYWLIILSIAAASVSWSVTQEEIFREPREYCKRKSKNSRILLQRKFFYVFTCEYCFSFWVTLALLVLTDFRLLLNDWRGIILAFFTIPWLANQWMSIYRHLRIDIKHEDLQSKVVEKKLSES